MKKITVAGIAALLMVLGMVAGASAVDLPGNQSAEFDHPGSQTQCDNTDPSRLTQVPIDTSDLQDLWNAECTGDPEEDDLPTEDVDGPPQSAP